VEKSHQVKLMSAIYVCASRLSIWLGPEGDDGGIAIAVSLGLGTRWEMENAHIIQSSFMFHQVPDESGMVVPYLDHPGTLRPSGWQEGC